MAAFLFWIGWFAYTRPGLDWFWPIERPLGFLIPAVVYPILEELVFRGFVQELLMKFSKGKRIGLLSLANVVTSILFAAMHLIYHAVLWAVAVFIPSLLFGYFKDKYQSVVPPIVLHVFYNCGYYWVFGANSVPVG